MSERSEIGGSVLPDCVAAATRRWDVSALREAGENRWQGRRYDHARRPQDVIVTLHPQAPAPADVEGLVAACGPVILTAAR